MNKISRIIQRFPVILAIVLLILTTLFCWRFFLTYQNTNIYYLSNLVYLICAFLLLVGAVKYKTSKASSAVLLVGASLLLVLTLSDFYILTFCFETSGPGGVNVITHRHWYNKFVSNNEYGFWERNLAEFEKPHNRKNQLVIAAVGDSFTWGQGVKGSSHRFTEELEKRLNAVSNGKKISVLNFGKAGADTIQETEVVNDFVSKVHPDIVLICYLSNDIDSDSFIGLSDTSNKYSERLSTITPTVNFIYWRLAGLSRYQDMGLQYLRGLVKFYDDPSIFQRHVNQLNTLFNDVRKIDAQPIFVLMPFPQMWQAFPKKIRDDIYHKIKEQVRLAGVPIIDLTYIEDKYSPEEFQMNPFDGHPNEKMHAEFAKAIYNWLVHNNMYDNLLKKQ